LVKLLAIDLDGTLISPELQISTKDIESIKKCRQEGVIVSIVTGRSIRSVGEITDMLGLKGLHLAASGSVIIDEKLKVYKTLKLPEKMARKIVQRSREWDRPIVVHTSDGFLKYEKYYPELEHIAENKNFCRKVKDVLMPNVLTDLLQITVLINEDDEFNQYLKETTGETIKIRRAGPYFLNILNKKSGKLFGIKEILKKTGVKKEELMVIGDTELDIGIIKYAGVGVAMGNASQRVKDAADYISSSNNKSGVSKAINKYILSLKE
jgi:Cof subfamily protein (haloacid dehalogenase superfamily)